MRHEGMEGYLVSHGSSTVPRYIVDEINALGGVQFEFQFEDDEHDAEKSVNAYNTLKDWGMQMLLGTVTSAPCIAVAAEDGQMTICSS